MEPKGWSELLRGAVTAIHTLTALPVPGKESRSLSSALVWFPLVGGLVAGLCWLSAQLVLLSASGWSGGAAFAALLCSVVATRGLHLDGLADWADGFFGGWDRQRVLEIMRDSRLGTFGVLAVGLALLGQWVALERLIARGEAVVMVPAFSIARASMAGLAATLPYARTDGGTGASFVRGARWIDGLGAWFIVVAIAWLTSGVGGLLLVAAGLVVTTSLGLWWRRRLGGVTGDLLGATGVIVETSLLLLAALAGHCFWGRGADWA